MGGELVLLVGLPGSGKTTLARELADSRPALRFTPDEWMIPLFGDSDADGKRDVLEGRLISVALRAAQLGTDAILDFGFWGRDERTALRALARRLGLRAVVLDVHLDDPLRFVRIDERLRMAPETTFAMSATDHAAWAALFQPPAADELDAAGPLDDPPAGSGGWAAWARARWPSLELPAGMTGSERVSGAAEQPPFGSGWEEET